MRRLTVLEKSTTAPKQAPLPKALTSGFGSKRLREQIVLAVAAKGGGWAIKNWSEYSWIKSVVEGLPLGDEEEEVPQEAQAYLLSHCKQRKCGTWLIALYRDVHDQYQTPQHIDLLHRDRQMLLRFGRNETKWRQYVSTDAWAQVPDAAFLAYIWWKNENPISRSHVRRIGEVPLIGIAPIGRAQKEIRERAIGQWETNDPQETFPAGALLATAFEEGSFPIGKVIETKATESSGSIYLGRTVPVQTALIWLTVQAERHKLLRAQVPAKLIITYVADCDTNY